MRIAIRGLAVMGMGIAALTVSMAPAQAQSNEVSECAANAIASDNATAQINALGRAKNLARQAAEAANGGLIVYQAAANMHGPVSIAPCKDNGNGSWTFTVMGGPPGFQTPSIETVVTVTSSANIVDWTIKVDSNRKV
jgi:hypothetical protein